MDKKADDETDKLADTQTHGTISETDTRLEIQKKKQVHRHAVRDKRQTDAHTDRERRLNGHRHRKPDRQMARS